MATIKIDDNTYAYDTANPVLPSGPGNQTVGAAVSSDTVTGGSGNDLLIGGRGSDTIEGGAGNDILVGGTLSGSFNSATSNKHTANDNAPDTFVFNFGFNASVAGSEQKVHVGTTSFVGSVGYDSVASVYGTSGSTDAKSFNAWMQAYEAWYASMMNDTSYIAEDDGVSDYTLAGTYRAGNKGTTTKTVSFSDFELYQMQITGGSAATASSNDGHDTIVDWFNGDKLALKGLAGINEADFSTLFNVESVTVGTRNGTKVSLDDGSWSVTILGMTGVTTDGAFHQFAVDNGWFI